MSDQKRYSTIANNYPSFQEIGSAKLNGQKWLQSREIDDNAEGLWRVHDTLYDLTKFADRHPGGADWIRLTKGVDITEAFEVHHINFAKATAVLNQYRVREAKGQRNFKLTFKETGFYRTLRTRVAAKLKQIDQNKGESMSKIFIDSLLGMTFLTSALTARFDNTYLMLLSSLCMCYTIISAHNFFHRRDNFRMLYFNLSFFNYKEWRITHAMSHHLYPNSLHDMEVSFFEPFLCWLPNPNTKGFVQRYLSWIYSPVIYAALFLDQLVKRTVTSVVERRNLFDRTDLIPLSIPLVMFVFGNPNIWIVLKIWLQIILTASFAFGAIGLNAGHHAAGDDHSMVHDGDKLREDLDWGIFSLDTVMDNTDLRKHHFLALTHFGHHALHHLFPTVDHGVLNELYPTLFETMDEFEVDLEANPWYHLVYGQLRQLARIETNQLDSLQKMRKRKLEAKLKKFD